MRHLSSNELISIFGGSEQTYKSGYSTGKAIKDAIVDGWDYVVGFWDGFWNS